MSGWNGTALHRLNAGARAMSCVLFFLWLEVALSLNPIRKVLLTLQRRGVQHLLMGGQACVFYGAAEFSRDTDVTLLADPENLSRLQQALGELKAEVVAVPPFNLKYLQRGHAIHFRCSHPEAEGMRLDVMSKLRGVDEFPVLWPRRTTAEIEPGEQYELMSLPDLVQAKKTQRDKDWPMIRRLIEADYQKNWKPAKVRTNWSLPRPRGRLRPLRSTKFTTKLGTKLDAPRPLPPL